MTGLARLFSLDEPLLQFVQPCGVCHSGGPGLPAALLQVFDFLQRQQCTALGLGPHQFQFPGEGLIL